MIKSSINNFSLYLLNKKKITKVNINYIKTSASTITDYTTKISSCYINLQVNY